MRVPSYCFVWYIYIYIYIDLLFRRLNHIIPKWSRQQKRVTLERGPGQCRLHYQIGSAMLMLMNRSEVRRTIGNFFDDLELLGVILELLGPLFGTRCQKVGEGCPKDVKMEPLGAARGSLRVTWEVFGRPLAHFEALLASL